MPRSVTKRASSYSVDRRAGRAQGKELEPLSLRKYPKVRRALPILFAVAILWYVYSYIWATHLSSAFTSTQGEPSCSPRSRGGGPSGNDSGGVVDTVVTIDSLAYDKLRTIGGTGHWFHLLERLVPAILPASDALWRPAYEARGASTARQHLYIVFQEAEGATALDSFCRLMLASVLGGGYYDTVFIGHSQDVRLYAVGSSSGSGSGSGIGSGDVGGGQYTHLAHVRGFTLTASLLFHPGEETAYSEALGGAVADHHSAAAATAGGGAGGDAGAQEIEVGGEAGAGGGSGSTVKTPSNLRAEGGGGGGGEATDDICAPNRMTLSWDLAPKKRYDLMGSNSTIYDLLHSAVDRVCGWEQQPDASKENYNSLFTGANRDVFVEHMQVLHPGYKKTKRLSRDITAAPENEDLSPDTVYRDDAFIVKNEYGAPLEASQIQGQMLQAGYLHVQDELSFPTSERFARKLAKYRNSLCTSAAGCNGTTALMIASNAAGLQVSGWKDYAAAQIKQIEKDDGVDNKMENAATTRDIANVNAVRSIKAGYNISMASLDREFILPLAPAATDAPLTLLVYDRDQTRRLSNAEAVVGYLRNALKITDDNDRHAYFPLHFSDEGIPRALPKMGLGSIGEINNHKVKHVTRRKSGRHVEDISNQVQYGHAGEKDQWVVDLMTHNTHGGHNDNVHVSGISGKPLESVNLEKRSRYPNYDEPLSQEDRTFDRDAHLDVDAAANADASASSETHYINVPKPVGEKAFGNGRRKLGWFSSNEDEDEDEEEEEEEESGSGGGSSSKKYTGTTTQHHPPCELLRQVKDSSVLITPHGFQSILLLFQPKKSVFIEIMPFAYHKPEIFGMIQAGLRSIPGFGEQRSYLVHESHPTSVTAKILHFLGLTGENAEEDRDRKHWFAWSQSKCTNWAICRHLVRDQDLVVDEAFLRRTADFIRNHFVNNKAIKNTDIFDF